MDEREVERVGGGVDGELLPVLLSPVRGRGSGEGDVTGLLETEESLDTLAEAKRRFGRSSSSSEEADSDAKS